MPHGLSYDRDGNIFLTDVALHQAFKFNKNQLESPELIFGTKFSPGNDQNHFCKPTDIQTSKKFIYISDGYCNSRVVVFDLNGRFVKEFGSNFKMTVVHSLSLIEELDMICVADRENGRAFCFDAGIQNASKLGELKKILTTHRTRDKIGKLFAIQNIGTYLFGVLINTNFKYQDLKNSVEGIMFDLKSNINQPIWRKDLPLNVPHDVTIDNKNNIYISEITNTEKLVKKFFLNFNQTFKIEISAKNELTSLNNKMLLKSRSKKMDDTKDQEEDLKNLATTEKNKMSTELSLLSSDTKPKSKRSSLLLLIFFISSLLLISIVLFFLKKRIGIENYFRSLGLPTKVIYSPYSKDSFMGRINDPERSGFNL